MDTPFLGPVETRPGVYHIRNRISGTRYIGSSKNIRHRWWGHLSNLRHDHHHTSRFLDAWKKYGPSAFIFEVLEYTETVEEAREREEVYLQERFAQTGDRGYNIAPHADTQRGLKHSEATKARMREAWMHRKEDPEHMEVMRTNMRNVAAGNVGQPFSLDRRAKMSASSKGKPKSVEHRASMSRTRKGRVWSEERRLRGQPSNKGRKHSPEWCAHISAGQIGKRKGKPWSPARRAAHDARLERLKTNEAPVQPPLFDLPN